MTKTSTIATMRGTMIVPGVSKNKRLYTSQMISRAYERMQERIATGRLPLTMLTHHEAGDDTTAVVGRIVEVSLAPNGALDYVAKIANTTKAKDILELTGGDEPFVRTTSIRGRFLGPVRFEATREGDVQTADDLEIDGLDFTKSPGIEDSFIDSVTISEAVGTESFYLLESTEGVLEVNDKPVMDVAFADPGYQKDGVKRYQLDTKQNALASWIYVDETDNTTKYSAKQLKNIKENIQAALREFGVDVTKENAAELLATEAVAEMQGGEPTDEGYVSVSIDNGDAGVGVSGWVEDPKDLNAAASRMAAAAGAAIDVVDPDKDGDVDVDGVLVCPACSTSNDNDAQFCNQCGGTLATAIQLCPACTAATQAGAKFCSACGAQLLATESSDGVSTIETTNSNNQEGSTSVSEESTTTNETETTVAEAVTPAGIAEAITAAVQEGIKEGIAAVAQLLKPAAEGTETEEASTDAASTETAEATPAAFSKEQVVEMLAAQKVSLIKDVVEAYGPPTRKGFVSESFDAAAAVTNPTSHKAPHEMSPTEYREWQVDQANQLLPTA